MQQQQNTNQNQQAIMNQPPDVMTTKDSLYLSDMLSWNILAMKKAYFFASQCQVPNVKAVVTQAAELHERHYQNLLQHLQGHLQNQNQPTQTLQ
jgi:hypothetical protein